LIFDKDTDGDGDCTDDPGTGSDRYFYCQQANYNVVALTDEAGAVVEKIKYDPYGEATVSVQQGQSATGNPYLFQGRRWDSEADLYYFRNRHYSPVLGRFMQRDPIGIVDSIDGLNLYQFLGSKPTWRIDPEGLACRVFFNCTLVSSKTVGCSTDCEYQCIEERRTTVAGRVIGMGTVDCDMLPKHKMVMYAAKSKWSLLCAIFGEDYCPPPSCEETMKDMKDYDDYDELGEWMKCSRAICRRKCETVASGCKAACKLLESGGDACEAACEASRELCREFCNSFCKN